ncbi:hypothetical protein GCM10018790_01610 [Kitasatospora xanthocidica]|uniref:hypothetical protein n=1 Tax=Kitasatospora xanthocidica TaxID=83382 RepID=UPI001679BA64|nr:hypothetical protein [Kitasatospora xanthocidica]GHF27902.1 hypothetical protein GCM10018790_01610 [Kitasatospora xanthocidica]
MADRDSVYNDPAYDITSVPSWKTPPLHGAYAPNAKLPPRVLAGIGAGAVVLAAAGMVAYSNYASASAEADVRKAQIALDNSRLELEKQKQAADLAKTGEQETPAQKARREAVQACVAKVGGGYGAIADCGKAFPAGDAPGMVNTSRNVASDDGGDGPNAGVGLVVLGVAGSAVAVGWVKRKFSRP